MTPERAAAIARLAGHDLAVYSADWCPDCTRLKGLLERERIPHRRIDIEDDAAAAQKLVKETGKRAIPFILVDGRTWVRGYHKERPERLNLDLLLQELGAAVGLSGKTGTHGAPMKEKGP